MFRAHLAATVAALVLAAGAVPASAQCVSAFWQEERGKNRPHFANDCSHEVTVFYCATERYRRTCGDNDNFYTHARIVRAGDTETAGWINGERSDYRWAACDGNLVDPDVVERWLDSRFGNWGRGFYADASGEYRCPE